MRKEDTIRKKLKQMRESEHRRYHTEEIGTLLWVLGEASNPTNGRKKEWKAYMESLKKGSSHDAG